MPQAQEDLIRRMVAGGESDEDIQLALMALAREAAPVRATAATEHRQTLPPHLRAGGSGQAPARRATMLETMAEAQNPRFLADLESGQRKAAGELGRAIVEPYDPRTSTGRPNLAGMAAAVAAVPFTGGGSLLARVAGPPLAAAAGGIMERLTAEPLITRKAPTASDVLATGATQAGMQTVGQSAGFVGRQVWQRVLGPRMARQVAPALRGEVEAARTAATRGVTAERTAGAERLTREVGQLDRQAAEAATAHEGRLLDLGGVVARKPLAPGEVSGPVTAAVEGPMERLRTSVMQKVGQAAESGPPVDLASVQAALAADISEQFPRTIFKKYPRVPEALEAIREMGKPITPEPPVTILNAYGQPMVRQPAPPPNLTVPFKDAHTLKLRLDDAINYVKDPAEKVAIERVTQGVRAALRDTLRVHEPYNAATEAAEQVFAVRSGAQGLLTAAADHPDSLVGLLKSSEPTAAAAIKSAVLEHSDRGGSASAGRAAWDRLTRAFIDKEIVAGDPAGVATRIRDLQKTAPDFMRTLFDTPAATATLRRLTSLGDAITDATARFETASAGRVAEKAMTTQAIKGETAGRVAAAQEQGRATVGRAVQAVQDFRASSLKPFSLQQAGASAAAVATPTSWRTAYQLVTGPRRVDIARWASRTDARTQQLIRALDSRVPDRAVAGLLQTLTASLGRAEDDSTPRRQRD